MRISKEFNERKSEILDASEKLFSAKGYDKCTVNDILEAVGIAKGTFYYYFESKEDVLDAIIERFTDKITKRAEKVLLNDKFTPEDKLLYVFLSMRIESDVDGSLLEEFNKPENALMHQKSLNFFVIKLSPILAEIVEEGIKQGVFKSEFPKEYMQIFLTTGLTVMNSGIFQFSQEERKRIFQALISLLEKMLSVQKDTLWNMVHQYT